jgi:hypothetical protein
MKNKEIKVWKEDFAIMKSRKFYDDAFVNIKDDKEITVIIDQSKIKDKYFIKIDKNWKLITINIVFGFNVIGIMAKISSALSKKGISIMPIAAYSRDHILVKKENLDDAVKVLREIEI